MLFRSNIETEWGTVFEPEQIADAIRAHQPRFVALVHGDTSTTMAQPLDEIGPLCHEAGTVVYVDATATLGGMPIEVDKWCLDAVTAGLQKCLSGPPGCSPLTINDRVAEIVNARKHVEAGIRSEDFSDADGLIVQSNYFDLAMLMDYWSSKRLNHHTEATTMLYAAHTCAQEVLREGLEAGFARHRIASQALRLSTNPLFHFHWCHVTDRHDSYFLASSRLPSFHSCFPPIVHFLDKILSIIFDCNT